MLRALGCPTLAVAGRVGYRAPVSASPRPRVLRDGTTSLPRPGECTRRTCVQIGRTCAVSFPHLWFTRLRGFARAEFSNGPSVSSLIQGNSFPVADPHTSTFSTVTSHAGRTPLFRKSLQFRAFARMRQVLTPSMPRNLCRIFFDGKFCSLFCPASSTFRLHCRRAGRQKIFFD